MTMPPPVPGKLGKAPARRDPRTLRYEDYRTTGLPLPPAQAHWGHGLPFGMLGNDEYGDCVEAEYLHQLQIWCDRAGSPFDPTEAEALAAYSAITGFSPGDPASDQGTDMLTACQYWQSTGVAGHQISAYLSVPPTSPQLVREAVAFYGGCTIGLQLPLSAQDQFPGTWTVTTGPDAAAGSWGGHCVVLTGYDDTGLWCCTWGTLQAMTWDWFQTYCDEAFILLGQEWSEADGQSPAGLAWGMLQGDLASL
jgi:hypothetical protein